MKKYLFIGLLIVGGFLFWLYNRLGGTQELKFEQAHVELYFEGELFEGKHGDPKIEDLFLNAREIAKQNKNFNLAIINHPAPKDSLRQFIGIASNKLHDTSQAFVYKETIKGNFIVSTINAHNLVMPRPESVRQQAEQYAQDNDLQLSDKRTIEIYKSERSLQVLMPVAQN